MNYLEKMKLIKDAGYKCEVSCFGKTVIVMKDALKAHFDPYHDTWKHWLNGAQQIESGGVQKFIDWYGENLELAVVKPATLTLFEEKLHKRLCDEGIIRWRHTKSHETQALKRLVKKGYATFDREDLAWLPVSEYVTE